MKLVSFFGDNRRRFGAIVDDKIFDLTDIEVDGQRQNGLKDVLGNESALIELERLLSKGNQPEFGLDDVSYMLPIPDPHKIFCVGRNYRAYHEVLEDGRPDWPSIFPRFVDSFSAHQESIIRGTYRVQTVGDDDGIYAEISPRLTRKLGARDLIHEPIVCARCSERRGRIDVQADDFAAVRSDSHAFV